MTCKAWLEGSCNCEQPCESDSNSAPEILAPVIINQRHMDEIKTQFKALAEVYDRGYATHRVWEHFNLVAKLLSVDIGGGKA